MRLLWLLMMVVEVVEGDGHQSGVSRCPPRDHVTRSLPDSGRLSPPDSGGQSPAGVRQTPQTLSDSSGLFQTPAGLELLSWQVSHWISPDLESGRLRRSPAESAGVRRSLPDYVGQCTVLQFDETTFSIRHGQGVSHHKLEWVTPGYRF